MPQGWYLLSFTPLPSLQPTCPDSSGQLPPPISSCSPAVKKDFRKPWLIQGSGSLGNSPSPVTLRYSFYFFIFIFLFCQRHHKWLSILLMEADSEETSPCSRLSILSGYKIFRYVSLVHSQLFLFSEHTVFPSCLYHQGLWKFLRGCIQASIV